MLTDNLHVPEENSVNPKLGDKIEPTFLEKVSAELKIGFRTAELTRGGDPIKVKITQPNVKQDMELSDFYTRKYNKLMKEGTHMTRKEIESQLKERKVWTSLEDKKVEQLNMSLNKTLEEFNLLLSDNPDATKLTELRKQYYNLRDKIFELSGEQSAHFINSVESICDHEQLLMKIVMCAKDENDNPIWSSWEILMEEKDRGFLNQVLREAQLFWSGLTTEVLYSLPDVLEKIHRGAKSEKISTE